MSGLADLTWQETQDRCTGGGLLIVPVGATEQHGPHLPLSTDTDIAVAIAERVALMIPAALVAPAVAYGSSGEHADFPGTLSIGRQATEAMLVELVRSASMTFALTVLVSSHGGNAEPAQRATELLNDEGHETLLWCPRWKGDSHAGRTETSVMLAIDPRRVSLSAAAAGDLTPIRLLMADLRTNGVRQISSTGVLGDPAGASAREGERLLDEAASDLLRQVLDWTRRKP